MELEQSRWPDNYKVLLKYLALTETILRNCARIKLKLLVKTAKLMHRRDYYKSAKMPTEIETGPICLPVY